MLWCYRRFRVVSRHTQLQCWQSNFSTLSIETRTVNYVDYIDSCILILRRRVQVTGLQKEMQLLACMGYQQQSPLCFAGSANGTMAAPARRSTEQSRLGQGLEESLETAAPACQIEPRPLSPHGRVSDRHSPNSASTIVRHHPSCMSVFTLPLLHHQGSRVTSIARYYYLPPYYIAR